MSQVENPKRIPSFQSVYLPQSLRAQEGFQEGLTPAPAPARAPALATQSVAGMLQQKRKEFLENAAKNKSPSAADQIAQKLTVKNVNDEIDKLLNSIDDLGNNKQLGDMFSMDMTTDTTMNQMKSSDLDTKKVMTQVNQATTQVSSIVSGVMRKGALLARLGVKKTQSFMMSWNDNVKEGCRKIAQALTNNNATEYEVSVFVDQFQKFCTALLIWIFIMNWYFVTFFVKENQRWTFDPTILRDFSITLYAIFGPSYRTLQTFNWALVEVPSLLRYSLSKKVIFFLMMLIFIGLVSANFHTTIVTDFFNSMEGRYSTSIFCVLAIFLVLGYALSFAFNNNESGWWQYMNVMNSIPGTVAFFFIVLLYLVMIAVIGIPLAMFFVSAFFVTYSFLGIFVYRGADTINTFMQISEDIANLQEINPSEYDTAGSRQPFDILKIHIYLWNMFYRSLRIVFAYAFELILLFILLSGISKYRSTFHDVMASKVKANQFFAKNGPVADSFKHLFSWLLIINIMLVIVIVVWMIHKWKTITMFKCNPRNGQEPPSFDLLSAVKGVKDSIGGAVTNVVDKQVEQRFHNEA